MNFGFISAGGGAWYSRTLKMLKPGDRVWVKIPGEGYVGVCRVSGTSVSASEFIVNTQSGDIPLREANVKGKYSLQQDDVQKCEYFVPVKWLQTKPREQAIQEIGFFGNQNSVCAPMTQKWRATVERLKTLFPQYNDLTPQT